MELPFVTNPTIKKMSQKLLPLKRDRVGMVRCKFCKKDGFVFDMIPSKIKNGQGHPNYYSCSQCHTLSLLKKGKNK